MIHVLPVNDLIDHEPEGYDCPCGPNVEWKHPDTGETYDVPLVTHHSLDGREQHEPA